MAAGLGVKIGATTSVAVSATPTGSYEALVRPTPADAAYATAIVDLADESGADANDVVVAGPNEWQGAENDELRDAVAAHGLSDVRVVPEALASLAAATAAGGELDHVSDGSLVVVYDLSLIHI